MRLFKNITYLEIKNGPEGIRTPDLINEVKPELPSLSLEGSSDKVQPYYRLIQARLRVHIPKNFVLIYKCCLLENIQKIK